MFQGNSFQGNAFQAGPPEPEIITTDKWLSVGPMPAPKRVLGTALATAIGLAWVPIVDTPRAEAGSFPVTYGEILPYQALAQTPFVQTAPEVVTVDKWLGYSVMPSAEPRTQFPDGYAAPVFTPTGQEVVTCDKWTGYSVFPKRTIPQTTGSVSEPPWEPIANPVGWQTDSPRPQLVKGRLSPDPAFVPPVYDRDFAPRLSWGTDSPFPAPAAARPRDRQAAFVLPPFDEGFAPRLSWETKSLPPAPAKARQQSDPGFVAPPYDGDFAPRLSWGTDSPSVPPLKARQGTDFAFIYPIAAPAEIVTVDKWLPYPSFAPTPAPRPASLFVLDPFPLPNTGEIITVDKWLNYSLDPLRRIARPESGAIGPVFWDVVFPDKWLSLGALGPQLRKPTPQQAPVAEPAYTVEVVAPLAWSPDPAGQQPRLKPVSYLRQLGSQFAFYPAPLPNADTAPAITATLTSSLYPKLLGYQYTRLDIDFSVSPSQPGDPIPNPPQTDFFTVSGEQVIDRFPFFGVSAPWDVKRRTQ